MATNYKEFQMMQVLLVTCLVGSVFVAHAGEMMHAPDHGEMHDPSHEPSHNEPSHEVAPSSEAPSSWEHANSEPPPETPFRGNWFKKRMILQEMRVSQEALRKMVQEVWIPDHKKFQEVYQPALDQMRDVANNLGFSEETVSDLITQIMEPLTTSTVSTSTGVTQVASPLQPTAAFDKDESLRLLKEMDESLKLLSEIRENVARAVQQAQQQEPLGKKYDEEAWKHYEETDEAYDDIQAARLYDQMRASEEYLQKLHEYLLRDLSPYINHLFGRYDALLKHIEMLYSALLKQGVILRKADIPPVKPPAPPPAPQPTWWQWLWSWITAPFYAIARWVGSLFGGSKK